MSMDSNFADRYLSDPDVDSVPSRPDLDSEPGLDADPEAPPTPEIAEPQVPPAYRGSETEVTQVVPAWPPTGGHRQAPNGGRQRHDTEPWPPQSVPAPIDANQEAAPPRRHAAPDSDTDRRYRNEPAARPAEGTAGSAYDMAAGADHSMQSRDTPRFSPPRQASATPAHGLERVRPDSAAAPWSSPSEGFEFREDSALPALRAEDVIRHHKAPPEMGWRKAVYIGSAKTINLGAGPAEQQLRDQIDLIKTNIPGNYVIGVVSAGGGVGKTWTTAGVGTAYATYRTEPVIAIDADPTYGGLGRVIDPKTTASLREFLADPHVNTYPMVRHYSGKNDPGLEVLGANQNVANPFDLTPQAFDAILGRVRRFYQLSLVDCGPNIEHPVMRAVLANVDALIIVGALNFDGALAAETTIKWLAARSEYHALLPRSALVMNDVFNTGDKNLLEKVRESLGQRVGGVAAVPWDAHVRDSQELDFSRLKRKTQLSYIDVAAWLAQGFRSGRKALR